MENNRYNPKIFFNISNSIKQDFKQKTIMIKNQAGELVTNKREVTEEFKIYFDKLLNNTTTSTNEHTNIQYSSVEPYISSLALEIGNQRGN